MGTYLILADIDWGETGTRFLGKVILVAVVVGIIAAIKAIALPSDTPSRPNLPLSPDPEKESTAPSAHEALKSQESIPGKAELPSAGQPSSSSKIEGRATGGYILVALLFVFGIIVFGLWLASYDKMMALVVALPLLPALINLIYAFSMKFELADGTLTIKRFPFIQQTIRVPTIQRILGKQNHEIHRRQITPLTIETATETIKVPPWLENQGALEMELAKAIASRTSLGYTKSTNVNSVAVDIKKVVQMAKERFLIEPHQMNRSLYRALGVAPGTINDFIDDLEQEMHLVPKTKIHVKECSVEDIIRSLTQTT